jgi:hypothetical protein
MKWSRALVLVVLGAALAGFAFSSAAARMQDDESPTERSIPAGPQTAELDWRETHGPKGKKLVFEVERLEVHEEGWRVRIALTNGTPVPYKLDDARAAFHRSFGLMLFASGDHAELEQRNSDQTLPALRPATTYEPRPPSVLEPGASWRGTISAPGSLVAGSWVRVVFGALVAVGATGDELDESVVWITDHAYRLRR